MQTDMKRACQTIVSQRARSNIVSAFKLVLYRLCLPLNLVLYFTEIHYLWLLGNLIIKHESSVMALCILDYVPEEIGGFPFTLMTKSTSWNYHTFN